MRIGIRIRINANCQKFLHRTLIRIRIRIALPALVYLSPFRTNLCRMAESRTLKVLTLLHRALWGTRRLPGSG
jgi:hypothetical protein